MNPTKKGKPKLCPDGGLVYWERRRWAEVEIAHGEVWEYVFSTRWPVPRIRIICPLCKRRIKSSLGFTHDGEIYHHLPPHKPKGWWKKKKKHHLRFKRKKG